MSIEQEVPEAVYLAGLQDVFDHDQYDNFVRYVSGLGITVVSVDGSDVPALTETETLPRIPVTKGDLKEYEARIVGDGALGRAERAWNAIKNASNNRRGAQERQDAGEQPGGWDFRYMKLPEALLSIYPSPGVMDLRELKRALKHGSLDGITNLGDKSCGLIAAFISDYEERTGEEIVIE